MKKQIIASCFLLMKLTSIRSDKVLMTTGFLMLLFEILSLMLFLHLAKSYDKGKKNV